MTVRNVLDVEYLDIESLLESGTRVGHQLGCQSNLNFVAKLQDSVQNKLPRYLLSSLNDAESVVRGQAVDLLRRLVNLCAVGMWSFQTSCGRVRGFMQLFHPS